MNVPRKGRPLASLSLFLAAALGAPSLLAAPPDLKVTSRFPAEPTGTMHFADSVTLRIGKAKTLVRLSPRPGFRLGCVTAGEDETCTVSFRLFPDDPASERRLTYRLAESNGGWRIRDLAWVRDRTLAGILTLPCE